MNGKVEGFATLVRPLVTLAVTGALIYGFIRELVSADQFLNLALIIVTFWFAQRSEQKTPNGNGHGTNGG